MNFLSLIFYTTASVIKRSKDENSYKWVSEISFFESCGQIFFAKEFLYILKYTNGSE